MATIEIQLKAYAKIIGTDRNCQVDLKRSVFQIDRDVNEIKIPLQAIVKLRKPAPSPPQITSSSILPTPQQTQMSLPVIPKLRQQSQEPPYREDPNMQAMVSTFHIPINIGNEQKMVKTTLRYKKAPQPVLTEIQTQTEEKQEPLSDIYPKDPVARALMFHQDRLQPVKQALREIKTKISNLRLEQKTTRSGSQGMEYYYGTDNSACPFIQYLMKQDQDGKIDMDTPISKIVGNDYFLSFQHEQLGADSQQPRPSGMVRPSIRISAVRPPENRVSSEGSGGSVGSHSKSVVEEKPETTDLLDPVNAALK